MQKIILSFFIFSLCLWLGISLAQRNPIENDESYSQHESIQKLSYLDILQGRVNEGNNSPLFYTLQKGFAHLVSFKLQTLWTMEQYVCEDAAQLWMRLLPILFMSLGITLSFYYFLMRYHYVAAFMALALFLTTTPTWIYWAQDRPYSLWFLLTCAQTILLSEYFLFKNDSNNFWKFLTITHWLLCLSSGFGFIQTLFAAIFIRKRVLLTFIVPILLGLFYALQAPRYPFRVPEHWIGLILSNVSLERLIFIFGASFMVKKLISISLWIGTMLGLSFLLIGGVYLQHTPGNAGFELSSRYLLFLMPTSIIIFNIFWLSMHKQTQNIWLKLALYQVLIYVLMMGGWRTWIMLLRLW
jgi:hypothetical protein